MFNTGETKFMTTSHAHCYCLDPVFPVFDHNDVHVVGEELVQD